MNVKADDVRNIWIEGSSYWGDNTLAKLFTQNILNKEGLKQLINWYAKQICRVMSGVYSLSTTVDITFILPKLDLKKSTKKELNFSNSIFCSVWKTEQLFIFFFFFALIIPKSIYKSVLLSIVKVPYKSVLLSNICCRHI